MAKLWYTKLTPSSFAATDAQAGYPASNIGLESLGRPWYSADAGAKEITINFAAATLVQALHLHDVNFASATIQKSVSGGAFTTVGTLTANTNEAGRFRGYLTINEALCTALKIQIGAGTPNDGLGYWRIGSGYAFAAVVALPIGPDIGYEIDTQESVIGTMLVNKRKAEARVGIDKDFIKIPWTTGYTSSLNDILRRTRLGSCLFSTDLANYPEEVWPVIRQEDNSAKSRFEQNISRRSITLTEIV